MISLAELREKVQYGNSSAVISMKDGRPSFKMNISDVYDNYIEGYVGGGYGKTQINLDDIDSIRI